MLSFPVIIHEINPALPDHGSGIAFADWNGPELAGLAGAPISGERRGSGGETVSFHAAELRKSV
jgi:hypothetical protein